MPYGVDAYVIPLSGRCWPERTVLACIPPSVTLHTGQEPDRVICRFHPPRAKPGRICETASFVINSN